jgi:hypothetical protein
MEVDDLCTGGLNIGVLPCQHLQIVQMVKLLKLMVSH